MDSRIRLIEALTYLGSSPDEIVTSLSERGVKGVRSNPYDCPISVYLALCGVPVKTLGWSFELLTPYGDVEETFEAPEVQGPLAEFVDAFDNGNFPELELAA